MADTTKNLAACCGVPSEGSMTKLSADDVAGHLRAVPNWRLDSDKLQQRFEFEDFVAAMRFVNAMASVAEEQGHHPDFSVHYNRVEVNIWTHAVGGLSINDFVLAAKLDQIAA